MTARDMTGQLYEGSTLPADVMQEVIDFGNVEPLCQLIEQGDAALWGDKRARDLIARIIRNRDGLRRGSGKRGPTNLIKVRRDEWIVGRMCFWTGFGLPLYGSNSTEACVVVADELERIAGKHGWQELDADSIINLWKKRKPSAGVRAFQKDCGKSLKDAAQGDASLRKKIKREYRFDVDRVLGDIK